MSSSRPAVGLATGLLCPLSLRVDEIAGMLNFELADHPVYDGGELQWFDDDVHGTGMLAFLSRRDSRRVDYYAQRGLRVDRGGYEIGGGTGSWTEIDFDVARLVVSEQGVDAEARFTDIDGRAVEIRVDDRDGRPRRPAGLLAPVSAGIELPINLLLVWMPRFDLVRLTGTPPVLRIDGVDVATGRLPGMRVHRRHLIKYAAPVVTVELNRTDAGTLRGATADQHMALDSAGALREVSTAHAGHRARLLLDPAVPDLAGLADGAPAAGRWHVEIDGVRLTGGTWSAARAGDDVAVELDVDERWKPGRLPWLMRLVTTVVPVFRRWPTTYRWRARVRVGSEPTMSARWERTGGERGRGYRRATGSESNEGGTP
jgi:hypothetical protein